MTRDLVFLELAVGLTMWLLIALAVILNSVKAPRRLIQVPLGLICVQFVFVVIAFSHGDFHRPAETALKYGIPAVAVAFTGCAIAYGLRHHRRTAS